MVETHARYPNIDNEPACTHVVADGLSDPDIKSERPCAATLDISERKRLARMLRAAVQTAPVELDDGVAAKASKAGAKALAAIQDRKDSAIDADIVRRANKIAAMKQNLDGISWDRVIDLCDRMVQETDPEARADLNAEVRLIAQANISLAYRLGIPLGQTRVAVEQQIADQDEEDVTWAYAELDEPAWLPKAEGLPEINEDSGEAAIDDEPSENENATTETMDIADIDDMASDEDRG